MIDTYWVLDQSTWSAREQTRNVTIMHKTICTMLGSDRASAGALWAMDDARTLIIRAHEMPDVETLRPEYRIMMLVASAPVPDAFVIDDTYRFQLTASNVKRDNRTRKIMPVHAEDWLRARAARNGFRVGDLDVHTAKIRGGQNNKTVLLSAAHYTGTLTVTDPAAFGNAMRAGIGRGKAYGCGLLTLA